MENMDFMKDVYDDFFGIEELKTEKIETNLPSKDERMARYYEEIEKLYVTEESKKVLKKSSNI